MTEQRHPDFARIHSEFIRYYCQGRGTCETGEREYSVWLRDLQIDETGPYGGARESFQFAKDHIQRYKEDKDNVYYRVLVGFPITSMNENTYDEHDLIAAAETLVGVPVDLNHRLDLVLNGVMYDRASYEDGAVEAILKVPKTTMCPICQGQKPLYQMIDEKKIVNVSLEASTIPHFHFTGNALLTTDVLPGIPMARIFPLEKFIPKMLSAPKTLKGKQLRIKVIGLTKKKEESKEQDEPPTDNHECPEGQIWDEGTQSCRPADTAGNPQGTKVDKGTPASGDTSNEAECSHINPDGTFIGGMNGCIEHMMTCKGLPEENAKKLCAYIGRAAGKIAMFTNKQQEVIIELLATAAKENIISFSDAALQISSLKVDKATLEAQLTGKTTELLETQKQRDQETNARLKADGRIQELEKAKDRLEKAMDTNNKEKIADETKVRTLERRLVDAGTSLEQTKAELEALTTKHAALDEKYRVSLQQNLDMSKRLTENNEHSLQLANEKDALAEKFKKAQRLAKLTVRMR